MLKKEWGLWGQLWFSGAKQKRKQKNSLSISNKTSLQSTGSKVKKKFVMRKILDFGVHFFLPPETHFRFKNPQTSFSFGMKLICGFKSEVLE